MTRELIIEGQHVDLAPDTDITLEYVSNILGDIGKINLSHSYTVRIPKTARNARILDDPGRPGHESNRTRKFLSAQYYRNGIDLIGQALAYILKTTPESYEIALVWNTLEALQKLSQSSKTLNDLPNLPTLTWIGPNGTTPDYTGATQGSTADGAFFASYISGLGMLRYPEVNAAPHPSMSVGALLSMIMIKAGVPLKLSSAADRAVYNKAVLAAPNHQPSRSMEIESGSVAKLVMLQMASVNGLMKQELTIGQWEEGWDAPRTYGGLPVAEADAGAVIETGENTKHRILLNFRPPVNLPGAYIYVEGLKFDSDMNNVEDRELLCKAYFKTDSEGGTYLYADEELSLSGWPQYAIGLAYTGSLQVTGDCTPYDTSLPMLAVNRVHEGISIINDNRFPLQGNLPDIKQWEFVKACAALFGWVPFIQKGQLQMMTYDEALATEDAYDWTSKVDMTDGEDLSYALANWAQVNNIVFEQDAPLGFEPNGAVMVEDTTLPESRDWFKLPFAASMQNEAQHYKVKSDNTVEDEDISPRIFQMEQGANGMVLNFTEDLYGDGLIAARYASLKEVIRKPMTITANIRLHEIDLAQLDLTRSVYLGQYGKYYKILKIQTSDTDLCKVELLQLP